MRDGTQRWPIWIAMIARVLPARYRTEIIGDLMEERERMRAHGRSAAVASVWLVAHLIRSAVAARWNGARGHGSRDASPLTGRGWSVAGELRQAVRSLRRAPWYAVTVIAVTGVGMALASTVFAVVDGVLFKPLPYPAPGELYAVSGRFAADLGPSGRVAELVSPNDVTAWAAAAPDALVTGIGYSSVQLPDGSTARAAAIDRRFFDVFGVGLLLGGFEDTDYLTAQPVMPVIIAHRLWQTQFEGDVNVIGRTIPPLSVFGQPYRIVGIMAADEFVPPVPRDAAAARRPSRIEVLRPPFTEALGERSSVAFARVPAAQRGSLIAALDRAVAAVRAAAPPLRPGLTPGQRRARAPFDRIDLVPLREYISSHERPAFALAFGTMISLVVLVLLNAAGLAAARAQQRIRDLSLRRALGAGTIALLRHAFAEHALLLGAGAIAGLVAAPMLLALVIDRLPEGTTLVKDARIDWRVVAFVALLSAVAAMAVALLSVRTALRQASAARVLAEVHGAPPSRARAGRLLIAGQTALAFAFVLGGVLFATSLARLWNEDPGFQPRNAAVMDVVYPVQDRRDFNLRLFRARALDLARQLRAMPGVREASVFDAPLMQNARPSAASFPAPAGAVALAPAPATVSIGSGFFDAADIRLVDGRLPSGAELDTGAPVIVVSESVARAFWPRGPVLGQTLRAGNRVDCTVVGIVRDVRLVALDVPSTGVIFSPWGLDVAVSTGPKLFLSFEDDAAPALERVRAAAVQIDSSVRLSRVYLLEDAMADTIRARRLGALAAGAFGVVALVFVALGLLGVVAMTSSRRTREVGVRLALGAAPTGIVRLFVREQLAAVLIGLAAGGILTAWGIPLIGAHVYGVDVYDPAIWALAIVVVLGTSTISAGLPAHRAGRIDVVASLREG